MRTDLPSLVTGGQVFLYTFCITGDKNRHVSSFNTKPICKGRFNTNPFVLSMGNGANPSTTTR